MRFKTQIFVCFIILLFDVYKSNAQEDWIEFIAEREKGKMISVILDPYYQSKKFKLNYLLIVTHRTKKCLSNGFPTKEGIDELTVFSDSTFNLIDQYTKNKLVGMLTYQCNALDVYYVKDTIGLRDKLDILYENKIDKSSNKTYIKFDKNWEYYKNLYPDEMTHEFISNNNVLKDFLYQGDFLIQKRNIKHWAFFRSKKRREEFKKDIEELKFQVDSVYTGTDKYYPYEIHFNREDFINPNYIQNLTKTLNIFIASKNGIYDGWESELIINE